jgi:Undecaprenyl-phosphate glucose phosphotransferase
MRSTVPGSIGSGGSKKAGANGTAVAFSLPRRRQGEEKREPAGNSQTPWFRPGVNPQLLAEIQAALFPAGTAFCALWAKIFYFDVILHTSVPLSFYIGAGALAAIVIWLTGSLTELHTTGSILTGEVRARVIVLMASVSFMVLLCLFSLLDVSGNVSPGWFALWYAFSLAFLLAAHSGILLWARLLRAETRLLQRVAVYGTPELTARVASQLFAEDRNLVLAGVFTDRVTWPLREDHAGGMRELIAAAQCGICDRIILAMPSAARDEILEAAEELEVLPIDVQLCPDAMSVPSEIAGANGSNGLVLIDLQRPPLDARGILLKIAMDYTLAIIALIGLSPLMLAISAAIKYNSPGPVLFVQKRHGYNHRVVKVFKFRTMTVAEDGPEVTQAVRDDKRVTRVGRFLRKTSLDELPQLFNVLRGELSLVGPRPHAVAHNESYERIVNRYANRHKVKPGITGWAQINGFRGETKTPEDMMKRVELDLHYIKHWSPWFDIKILARTALVPFFHSDVY